MSKSLSGLNEGIFDTLVSSSFLTEDGHNVISHSRLSKGNLVPDYENQAVNDLTESTEVLHTQLKNMNKTGIPTITEVDNNNSSGTQQPLQFDIPDIQQSQTEFVDSRTFQTNIPPILTADLTVDTVMLLRTEIPNVVYDGIDGRDGINGTDGLDGIDGIDGQDGQDGKSTYEIWQEFNTGTKGMFLEAVTGKDGQSAFDIWIDEGNEGTEEEFLASLKGADGDLTQELIDAKNDAVDAKEKAETAKTDAETAETAAKTSEDNAGTSATNAKTSEDNAKTSENNAKISENAAVAAATAIGLGGTAALAAQFRSDMASTQSAAAASAEAAQQSADSFSDYFDDIDSNTETTRLLENRLNSSELNMRFNQQDASWI
jgi:hypothetical protein